LQVLEWFGKDNITSNNIMDESSGSTDTSFAGDYDSSDGVWFNLMNGPDSTTDTTTFDTSNGEVYLKVSSTDEFDEFERTTTTEG
jgi:hypothetical protein